MVNNPPLLRTAAPAATTALVLVVAPFEENAKRIESHLRNAGHKMRAVWVSDAAELEPASLPITWLLDDCRKRSGRIARWPTRRVNG